jgi:cytochrome oxidase assembly protein ShyY1
VIRRFVTLRWLTIHFLTVAIVVIFIMFGRWQLHRWEGSGAQVIPPDNRPAVTLTDLVAANQALRGGSIGRQTSVTGRFDGAHQVLIADRQLGGRAGFWVVTALRPDGYPSGTAVLVVRGWVATPTDPALRVADTQVDVSGRVYASEDPPPTGTGPTASLPAGQFREVNTAELTGAFPYRLLDGYVLLARTDPALADSPAVVPTPVMTRDSGGGLYHLAYAVQWWLFALAVLYFWVKLVREDLTPSEERVYQRETPASPTPEPTVPASARIPAPTSGQPVSVGSGTDTTAGTSTTAGDDAEDAELAAYNRYLADLNARSGRRS